MAVVPAAFRKAFVVGGVAREFEHPRFLAIAGHFFAFEVSHVRGKGGRAEVRPRWRMMRDLTTTRRDEPNSTPLRKAAPRPRPKVERLGRPCLPGRNCLPT